MPLVPSITPARRALTGRLSAGFRSIVSGHPGSPDWVLEMSQGEDQGYFGPGSTVWAVHGDLATLVGGIRALLMQALHPAAVTGIDQHSSYRQDPLARLAGTTRWLTVTSFGSCAQADRECARVRGLHRRVRGRFTDVDGAERAYRADEQPLLTWVHAAFTDSFLTAHRVFGGRLPGGPDGYLGQWARAGELVGLHRPPRTARELDAVVQSFGPDLARTPATDRTVAFIRRPPLPAPARLGYAVLFAGAVSTLRPEHRRLLGLPDRGVRAPRAATRALLRTLAAVLGDAPPAAQRAADRVDRLQVTGRDQPQGGCAAEPVQR